jgi:hypothetical protein
MLCIRLSSKTIFTKTAGMKLHEFFVISRFVSCSHSHVKAFNSYSPFSVPGHALSDPHLNRSLHKTQVSRCISPWKNWFHSHYDASLTPNNTVLGRTFPICREPEADLDSQRHSSCQNAHRGQRLIRSSIGDNSRTCTGVINGSSDSASDRPFPTEGVASIPDCLGQRLMTD